MDESHHLAKVRVAGSNPVFRSDTVFSSHRDLPIRSRRRFVLRGEEFVVAL